MSEPIEVVAGIIWRDGFFLGVERPEGSRHAGFWEFPGGKVEPGESREDALSRELGEELGIAPLSREFWVEKVHDYGEFSVRLYFFHVREFSGEPQPLEGHCFQWLTPGMAREKKFLPADEGIVRRLGREFPNRGEYSSAG